MLINLFFYHIIKFPLLSLFEEYDNSILHVIITVISIITAAIIHSLGIDTYFIIKLFNNEPKSPPNCIINEFTDNIDALTSLSVSPFNITPSAIFAIPNIKYIKV